MARNIRPSFFSNSEDQIFIGAISTTPTVGKVFEKRASYSKALQQLKESVEFSGFFNKADNTKVLTLFNAISEVDIVERIDCIFISVWFKGRSEIAGFSGLTDTKGIGYKKFLEKYKEKQAVVLSLVCRETNEETIVLGIKNIHLRTL